MSELKEASHDSSSISERTEQRGVNNGISLDLNDRRKLAAAVRVNCNIGSNQLTGLEDTQIRDIDHQEEPDVHNALPI